MALFIKSKATLNVYADKTHVYGGGIVCAFRVNPGESPAIYCPVIVYDDAVSFGDDKLEVQTPKAVSELFWAYEDSFVDITDINPDLNAVPEVVSIPLPTKAYTNFAGADYDTTFKLTLVNPNGYKVQFATNRMGTLDVNGYPLIDGYVDVSPDAFGKYSIETASHTSNNQTIWSRYKRADGVSYEEFKRTFSSFKPMDIYLVEGTGGGGTGGGGGGGQTTGNAQLPLNNVPLLAHIWPMLGKENPNQTQGTYEDDLAALQEKGVDDAGVLQAFPWFSIYSGTTTPYQVSRWVNGVDQGDKRAFNSNWSFNLNDLVMTQYIDYAVRCGIQGFMMLNYANDAYISLFRRIFRKPTINKRGIKICYSLNFGGGGRTEYVSDENNNNPVFSPYRQTIYDMASDLTQGLANGWYATARKLVSGTPTQVPIFHVLIETAINEEQVSNNAWEDLARIKAKAGYSGETFNIKMTSGPDLTIGLGGADDANQVWNATTSYYLQPEISAGFSDSGRILDANLVDTPCANKIPMVSWGYNSDPRRKFHGLEGNGGFPYNEVETYMPILLNKLKGHMNNNSKDLRVALCGQVGEFAEQGQDLFPNYYNRSTMFTIFKDKFVDNR